MLSLGLKDLISMRKEFFDCYDELFDADYNRMQLGRILKLKCRAIKSCKKQIRDQFEVLIPENQRSTVRSTVINANKKKIKLKYDNLKFLHIRESQDSSYFRSSNRSSSISDTLSESSNSFRTDDDISIVEENS